MSEKTKIEISLDCSDYFEGTINGYIESELFHERDMELERYKYRLSQLLAKNKKLKRLMLLTDPAVESVVMNDLTQKQWSEYVKVFPEEK